MVAPALIATAATKALPYLSTLAGSANKLVDWMGGEGAGLMKIGGNLTNYLGGLFNGSRDNSAAQAYQSYLNGITGDMQNQLEGRADKYDTKLQDLYNTNSAKFDTEANTQLPELGQLVTDIANQSAEAQRQNQRQINASLAQQGVRGGQASILANRATGELNRDLQRDINKTVYDEAANRQSARLNNYSQQSLLPLQGMTSGYSSSLSGANNSLSQAQGTTYANAYNRAMANYGNTQKTKGLFG